MSDEPDVHSLLRRIEAIEKRDIEADLIHVELRRNDGMTAEAVRDLTRSLNDPRSGLIVELDKFKAEVVADREQFKATVRGAVAVLSAIFAIFTVISPWLRAIVEMALNVRPPS